MRNNREARYAIRIENAEAVNRTIELHQHIGTRFLLQAIFFAPALRRMPYDGIRWRNGSRNVA